MAVGDSKRTSRFDELMGLATFNMNTDVFKWVFITESYTAIDANSAAIGIAGFTKVTSAGAYVQDETLSNSTWSRTGNVTKLDFDDFSFVANGANPVTAKTLAIYDDTSAGKEVYKFVDLTTDGGTTPADTTLGFTYTVASGGSGTITTG